VEQSNLARRSVPVCDRVHNGARWGCLLPRLCDKPALHPYGPCIAWASYRARLEPHRDPWRPSVPIDLGVPICPMDPEGLAGDGLVSHLLRAAVDGSRTAGRRSRCRGVRSADEGVGAVVGQSMMDGGRSGPTFPPVTLGRLIPAPGWQGERRHMGQRGEGGSSTQSCHDIRSSRSAEVHNAEPRH
jgi:hypothetical protein